MSDTIKGVEKEHAGHGELDAALDPSGEVLSELHNVRRVERGEDGGVQQVCEREEVERAGQSDTGYTGQRGEVPCEL